MIKYKSNQVTHSSAQISKWLPLSLNTKDKVLTAICKVLHDLTFIVSMISSPATLPCLYNSKHSTLDAVTPILQLSSAFGPLHWLFSLPRMLFF